MSHERENKLLKYQASVLTDAGFPENCIKYLLDKSRGRLSGIDNSKIDEERELLERNLTVLVFKLAEKEMSACDLKQKFKLFNDTSIDSERNLMPSQSYLHIFKKEKVFDQLTIDSIKAVLSAICPIHPWC